jgi:hypothetical protein
LGDVVTAAYSRPAGGRNEPAKFEWPALLRKLDRIDPPTTSSHGTSLAAPFNRNQRARATSYRPVPGLIEKT